jgi:high-affinity nickel permease
VDVFMAVFALNVIDKMGACVMLRPFLLVTSVAHNRFRMNPCPFGFGMGFDIRDIVVATVAGVSAMNGLGKFRLADLRVATQTFGIVNTLVAIFPTFDTKLLHLFR